MVAPRPNGGTIKKKEGVEFVEAANTPIPGGIVVNIAYLIILRKGGLEKS